MRVVGFLEYRMALQNFDSLVSKATQEELDAIDDIIDDHPEYAIYTNLSRRLVHPASTLDETAARPEDDFRRHSLAWMMGLARVELGAMLAAFTELPAPFAAVQPTRYDLSAYKELLQDGLRTHYWALVGDPQLGRIASRFHPTQQSLAYIKRLVVARAFVLAVLQSSAQDLSQPQLAELGQWRNQLDRVQGHLVLGVQNYLAAQRAQGESFLELVRECDTMCQRSLLLGRP